MEKIMALLERARAFELETQVQLEHIERLRRIAASTRKNVYASEDYSARIVEKLAALEAEMNAQVDRTVDAKRNALVYLSFLEGEERSVIESYYSLGKSWAEIAEKLYMSERRVFLLRKSALERIERHFCKNKNGGKDDGNRNKNKAAS